MRSHVHLKEILAALGPRGLTAYWTIGDVASRTRQALPFPTSFIQADPPPLALPHKGGGDGWPSITPTLSLRPN